MTHAPCLHRCMHGLILCAFSSPTCISISPPPLLQNLERMVGQGGSVSAPLVVLPQAVGLPLQQPGGPGHFAYPMPYAQQMQLMMALHPAVDMRSAAFPGSPPGGLQHHPMVAVGGGAMMAGPPPPLGVSLTPSSLNSSAPAISATLPANGFFIPMVGHQHTSLPPSSAGASAAAGGGVAMFPSSVDGGMTMAHLANLGLPLLQGATGMMLPPGQGGMMNGVPSPHLFPPLGTAQGAGMRPGMGVIWPQQQPIAVIAGGRGVHYNNQGTGGDVGVGPTLRRSRSSSGGDSLNLAETASPNSSMPPPPPRSSAPAVGKGPGSQHQNTKTSATAAATSAETGRVAASSGRPVGTASFVVGSVSVSTRRRHSGGGAGSVEEESTEAPEAVSSDVPPPPPSSGTSVPTLVQRKQLPPPTAVAAVVIPVPSIASSLNTSAATDGGELPSYGATSAYATAEGEECDIVRARPHAAGSSDADPNTAPGVPQPSRSWRQNLSVSVPTATPVIPLMTQPQDPRPLSSIGAEPPHPHQDLVLTSTSFPPLVSGSSPTSASAASASALALPQGGSWMSVAAAPPTLPSASVPKTLSEGEGSDDVGTGGRAGVALRGTSDSGLPSSRRTSDSGLPLSRGTAQMMPYAVAVALPPPPLAVTAGGYAASLTRTSAPTAAKRNLSGDGRDGGVGPVS